MYVDCIDNGATDFMWQPRHSKYALSPSAQARPSSTQVFMPRTTQGPLVVLQVVHTAFFFSRVVIAE
jgi:hypothetical protein